MCTQTERILNEVFSYIDILKEDKFKAENEFEQLVYQQMIDELNDFLGRFEVGKLEVTGNCM